MFPIESCLWQRFLITDLFKKWVSTQIQIKITGTSESCEPSLEPISDMDYKFTIDCNRNFQLKWLEMKSYIRMTCRDLYWLDELWFRFTDFFGNLPLKIIIHCVTDQSVTSHSRRSVFNFWVKNVWRENISTLTYVQRCNICSTQ